MHRSLLLSMLCVQAKSGELFTGSFGDNAILGGLFVGALDKEGN